MTDLTINGKTVSMDLDPETPILWALRDTLEMTGTKFGCGIAQCGACTVHIDGRAVKSCSILAVQAQGKQVTTIEGISQGEALHPVQQAFRECHGLQCGFCT
ncbi:(2Fe-2S)-binding protein, partial [Delftia acidovorans]|uniref:(2Fe-2S)-binding protein n=1 Tax=Delftia acidovorans TaxID=80866 RepID=UPI00241E9A9C